MIAIGSFPCPGQTSKINLIQPSSQYHPLEATTNPSVLATSLILDYLFLSFFIVGAKAHTAVAKSKNRIPHCLIKIDIIHCENHTMWSLYYEQKWNSSFPCSVQFSHVQHFATPWIAALQASLSVTNSRSSLTLTSIKSVMPSCYLILCRPLLLLPPIPPSIRVFSNESALRMRWPKYWSFSLSISPSNEHPGLISCRMDWLDLLAVQRTLQHYSSKASILLHSAFFIVQLSHPYMTTGKTIALTRRTFVGKMMSLLFNMLSRLVITFLPRSKRLLISWLQSPSAVIL